MTRRIPKGACDWGRRHRTTRPAARRAPPLPAPPADRPRAPANEWPWQNRTTPGERAAPLHRPGTSQLPSAPKGRSAPQYQNLPHMLPRISGAGRQPRLHCRSLSPGRRAPQGAPIAGEINWNNGALARKLKSLFLARFFLKRSGLLQMCPRRSSAGQKDYTVGAMFLSASTFAYYHGGAAVADEAHGYQDARQRKTYPFEL